MLMNIVDSFYPPGIVFGCFLIVQKERRREMRWLRFETWRGKQEPSGHLRSSQCIAVDCGFGSRVEGPAWSPTSSFQHANHGKLLMLSFSCYVVSNRRRPF